MTSFDQWPEKAADDIREEKKSIIWRCYAVFIGKNRQG